MPSFEPARTVSSFSRNPKAAFEMSQEDHHTSKDSMERLKIDILPRISAMLKAERHKNGSHYVRIQTDGILLDR